MDDVDDCWIEFMPAVKSMSMRTLDVLDFFDEHLVKEVQHVEPTSVRFKIQVKTKGGEQQMSRESCGLLDTQ